MREDEDMATGAQIGRKTLIGFVSTISWLVLLASFLATAALLSVDNLKHVGNSASAIVSHFSKSPSDINSLIDDFKKDADLKTIAEIDKNRAKINETIASLGGSKEFQDSLASTLNKISGAILNGSSSVEIDFSKLATIVANAVNKASDSVVISKKELAKLKPKTLNLGKQSKVVNDVHSRIAEVMLCWILWLVLLAVLYLLKRWGVLRTAGWQFFSIGTIFLLIRYGAPSIANHTLTNSTMPIYQRDLIPQVLKAVMGPIVEVSVVACVLGLVLIFLDQLRRQRMTLNSVQISPSVVA